MQQSTQHDFGRLPLIALGVGVAGTLLWVVGWVAGFEWFFSAYLFAYLFWLGIALGSLALLAVYHMVGGAWGFLSRRILEAATLTLPLLALLFLPILFGMPILFPWARPGAELDPLLAHKIPYLNTPFFIVRAALYFVIWISCAVVLNRLSNAEDRTGDPQVSARLRLVSRATVLLGWLAMVFAAKDWAMSLEPSFYSTIYSMLFIAGQILAGMAFATLLVGLLSRRAPLAEVATHAHFNTLGNVLLATTMLWAYLHFSQYLIIWTANLPEEITWYLTRSDNGWIGVTIVVIAVQFVLPFFALLARAPKSNVWSLTLIAGVILLFNVVYMFWMIVPPLRPVLGVNWLDFAALFGIGGLWLAAFAWMLGRKPLLARHDLHDPRLGRETSPFSDEQPAHS